MKFKVYTDGACKGNPGKGGFAYIVYDDIGTVWYEGHGTHQDTTNNQMELLAVIESLRVIKKNQPVITEVEVFSDSAYVVNCFNDDWISKWEKNGFKTKKGKPVLNQEFWEVLSSLVKQMNVKFTRLSRSDKQIKKVDEKAKQASKL